MGNYQVIVALYHQRITEDSKALKKSLAQTKKCYPTARSRLMSRIIIASS
ncbi:hypothetical protein [Streptococcus suis]|nr:hypothetical protein [Streptococcus suis]MCP8328296.1 hypothetical protein [Streptococcus suis]MCP8647347.1 hypothetical protein [Streptococcus suis]